MGKYRWKGSALAALESMWHTPTFNMKKSLPPLLLEGDAAFSSFRITGLQETISRELPSVSLGRIEARYVFILETAGKLTKDAQEKTFALLAARRAFSMKDGFLVTPRKGTISPWSSKATDIFRNCGLDSISRVERGIHFQLYRKSGRILDLAEVQPVLHVLHDRMTEGVYTDVSDIFRHIEPVPYKEIDILKGGRASLDKANVELGLALSAEEIDYLYSSYGRIKRNPTDVELVMFGQVNSEHCRHKIFNADWIIDGKRMDATLFKMIRNTHEKNPGDTIVAYKDNSSVVGGFPDSWFEVRPGASKEYGYEKTTMDMLMKVETHNHPTAISPFPGAATGVGGEIRDEAATGIGGKSKAGLSGFMVSNLRVPGYMMPWELDYAEFPDRLASPLDIMIQGPIGGAAFGNEFGRPQLLGLFRTYEEKHNGRYRGYHKPIMAAGGLGNIKREHVQKKDLKKGAFVVQLGGPAMRIGLGGGAASSMATGSNAADLDFNSVQRGNAEMERRCQEAINACIALKKKNPILSIHDIGAGGLSNGCPELVSETGGKFWLRKVPNEDRSMSPMEIWCCEAQERYVLAIAKGAIDDFLEICARERCPAAVIGEVTGDDRLVLEDEHFKNKPIDIDLGIILGKPPKMLRDVSLLAETHAPLDLSGIKLRDAVTRVLRLPAVANKTFLITITDRTVMGMAARDQMTGPYQTPISDLAVTITSHKSYTGEAMTMGERTPVAVVSPAASGRMAVGESITNIAAANIGAIGNLKLSANWMCACGEEGEDAGLYATVKAVGMELCPALGISIPVGKDSLSMRTLWTTSGGKREKVVSPLSLIVSAFSLVRDVRKTVTPDLKKGESELFLLDLGQGRNRLGCSALAQVYNQVGNEPPDLDDPALMIRFFDAIQEMVERELILAYHDRSDGGLFVTLAEMAFGGRLGVDVSLGKLGQDELAALFAEELGAVIQVSRKNVAAVKEVLKKHGVESLSRRLGVTTAVQTFSIKHNGLNIFSEKISTLNGMWSELTYKLQALRDNPECARQEYECLMDEKDPGMQFKLSYNPSRTFKAPAKRPRVAIMREQGINGQVEMAAAFDKAGFTSIDVHMTDLLSGRVDLASFSGVVACGGFSYGDVLGAGSGWAKSILYNAGLKEMFRKFFERKDTFGLGICNGCQMMSQLKDIIPGAEDWPAFTRNKSEQFEARFVTVEILQSPSIFFKGMEGSRIGIPVAHGEGFANFGVMGSLAGLEKKKLLAVRFVDNYGKPAERYPANPNGSPGGITGVTTKDGRVTIMMPHPERAFRSVQMSYRPAGLLAGEEGPWLTMFQNAREFVRVS